MAMKDETLQTYNTSAVLLAKKFNGIGPRIKDIDKAFSYVKKINPSVFEIGCGNGRDAKIILKKTRNYLGIDYSSEMIKLAKSYVPTARFIVADAKEYEYPKNIDIVFSFASLIHFDKDEFKSTLEKLHKSLSDEGITFISLKYGRYKKVVFHDEFGKRIYYLYSPSLVRKLAGNKFRILYLDVTYKVKQKWLNIILKKI